MTEQPDKNKNNSHDPCYQCEGQGYTEIRDCAGEIQRTDTCSYCEGTGYANREELAVNLRNTKMSVGNHRSNN